MTTMGYNAKIIKDSISPDGYRFTTVEATYPRFVHSELMTHRIFSRNTASSRAIPVEKTLTKVLDDPVLPVYWGANQSGMQAEAELSEDEQQNAETIWLETRDIAVLGVVKLLGGIDQLKSKALSETVREIESDVKLDSPAAPLNIPLHKQIANRILEPFLWHTAIISSTEWENFYALRAHEDAQPEIRVIAELLRDEFAASKPEPINYGEHHLPLLQEDERDLPQDIKIRIAIGRCARISYLTHEGVREIEKDIELYDRLVQSGHMSPLEHVARPWNADEWVLCRDLQSVVFERAEIPDLRKTQITNELEFDGNLRGWHQHRKDVPHENNYAEITGQSEA